VVAEIRIVHAGAALVASSQWPACWRVAAYPTRLSASPTAARNPCGGWDVCVSCCAQHYTSEHDAGARSTPNAIELRHLAGAMVVLKGEDGERQWTLAAMDKEMW